MPDNTYVSGEVLNAGETVSPGIEKYLKRFIVVAALFLAAELCWFFLLSPCMALSRVEVSEVPDLSRSRLLAQAGIDDKTSYISLNIPAAERALAALPQVESVRVIKVFPSSAALIITGRKALAASLAQVQDRQALVIFDRQGVVFKIVNPGDPEAASLPLISGLNFTEAGPGSRPGAAYGSLLSNLSLIRNSAADLFSAISEIRINRRIFHDNGGKAFETFDLTLFFMHRPVRVLAEADLDEDTLRYILLTVDALISRDPRIDEIDFRAGIASYTIKEASSG